MTFPPGFNLEWEVRNCQPRAQGLRSDSGASVSRLQHPSRPAPEGCVGVARRLLLPVCGEKVRPSTGTRETQSVKSGPAKLARQCWPLPLRGDYVVAVTSKAALEQDLSPSASAAVAFNPRTGHCGRPGDAAGPAPAPRHSRRYRPAYQASKDGRRGRMRFR
jgi:hypothetical protein